MENQEEIHDVLSIFEKKPSKDIPPLLEEYLRSVAKTGKTLFPWLRLKLLFINKLEQVMEEFNKEVPYDHLQPFPNVENVKYEDMRRRVVDAVQKFNGAPFTVQRLCELVTQPRKHYTRCDKFLRGIEKNVMVVSTVDATGRKIVSESSRNLVNGLDVNGFNLLRNESSDIMDGQSFAPLPPMDWSANNTAAVASVWPTSVAIDNVQNVEISNGTDTPTVTVENIGSKNREDCTTTIGAGHGDVADSGRETVVDGGCDTVTDGGSETAVDGGRETVVDGGRETVVDGGRETVVDGGCESTAGAGCGNVDDHNRAVEDGGGRLVDGGDIETSETEDSLSSAKANNATDSNSSSSSSSPASSSPASSSPASSSPSSDSQGENSDSMNTENNEAVSTTELQGEENTAEVSNSDTCLSLDDSCDGVDKNTQNKDAEPELSEAVQSQSGDVHVVEATADCTVNTEKDGPPEKKMRLDESEEAKMRLNENEVATSSDADEGEPAQASLDLSQGSTDETLEESSTTVETTTSEETAAETTTTAAETKVECSECVQPESNENTTESQSDNSVSQSDDSSSENKHDIDHSDISSSDDAKQSETCTSVQNEDQSDSTNIDQSQQVQAESVSQSESTEHVTESVNETTTSSNEQTTTDTVNVPMVGNSETENISMNNVDPIKDEGNECNSTTEVMETDPCVEEKTEASEAQSTTDETEPMDQE